MDKKMTELEIIRVISILFIGCAIGIALSVEIWERIMRRRERKKKIGLTLRGGS